MKTKLVSDQYNVTKLIKQFLVHAILSNNAILEIYIVLRHLKLEIALAIPASNE